MWYRLQAVSWLIIFLLLLGSSTGIAYAAAPQRAWSPPTTLTLSSTPEADFSSFTGLWVAHSAFMVVARDGNVRFSSRTYLWCDQQQAQPCDSLVGDQLRFGYHVQLLLSRVNGSSAYGTVLSSNTSSSTRNSSVTLTLGPNQTLFFNSDSSLTVLCRPTAPAGACGA